MGRCHCTTCTVLRTRIADDLLRHVWWKGWWCGWVCKGVLVIAIILAVKWLA